MTLKTVISVCCFHTVLSAQFDIFHSNLYQVQYSFSAALYEDALYTIGGLGESGVYIEDEYNTTFEDPFSWQSRTISLPSFSDSSVSNVISHFQNQFLFGNILYIVKPELGTWDYRTLLKYDLSTHSYLNTSAYDSISDIYQYGACVTYNSKLNVFYSIGGLSTYDLTATIDAVEIYNLTSDEWTTGISLYEPRFGVGCAMDVNSEYIYAIAGYYSDYKDTILRFNVSENNWSLLSLPTIKTAAYLLKCHLFIDDNIYCIGGYNGGSIYLADVNIFNPSQGTINTSYSLNTERAYFALFSYKNCIYVAGGKYAYGSSYLSDIEYLCITTLYPSISPSFPPSKSPTSLPTMPPTTIYPTKHPTAQPTYVPTFLPTGNTFFPSGYSSTLYPSSNPVLNLSYYPTYAPTANSIDPKSDDGKYSEVMFIVIAVIAFAIISFVVGFAIYKVRHKQTLELVDQASNKYRNAQMDIEDSLIEAALPVEEVDNEGIMDDKQLIVRSQEIELQRIKVQNSLEKNSTTKGSSTIRIYTDSFISCIGTEDVVLNRSKIEIYDNEGNECLPTIDDTQVDIDEELFDPGECNTTTAGK